MKLGSQQPLIRIAVDILLVICIFTLPWFALVAAIVAACFLPQFYELIAIGIVIDIFFGMSSTAWHGLPYWATIIAVIVFFSIRFIKSRLR